MQGRAISTVIMTSTAMTLSPIFCSAFEIAEADDAAILFLRRTETVPEAAAHLVLLLRIRCTLQRGWFVHYQFQN